MPIPWQASIRFKKIDSVNPRAAIGSSTPLALMKKSKTHTSPAKKKYSILVVDDHPLFRKGLAQLLDSQPDLLVQCEAGDSGSALDAIRAKRFDLAIVDIGLHGGADGIELTKSLKAEQPTLPVLVVSMHDEALYAERALAGWRARLRDETRSS